MEAMKKFLPAALAMAAALCCLGNNSNPVLPAVSTIRVPNGGIQPQVVEHDGVVHMIYFLGDAEKGDLFYVRSKDYGRTFSSPMRVNRDAGSAIAVGNIRGAQLAVGRNGRVHVAWNGTHEMDRPGVTESYMKKPMLYARLNDAATGFEPERNVIGSAWGLDGGGSLAADSQGNVYVFWHAPIPGKKGEDNRRVWVARSTDDGKSFAQEAIAYTPPVGACGCCGLKTFADTQGAVYALFRSATEVVHRDIYLIASTDHGRTFHGNDISPWNIGACVMSSESIAQSQDGIVAAWETEKQVYFAQVKAGEDRIGTPIRAPGPPNNRKYPALAVNNRNDTLLAWTEGTAWKKGGAVAWQVFGKDGRPEPVNGKADGVPVWSLVAAFARPDGAFVVVY
jgi:hypothetical protein